MPRLELLTATLTPFTRDGKLDLAKIPALADLYVRNGVDGVFVNGSTGESLSLTCDERLALAARWCEVGRGRLKVLIHVGHNSLPEALRMAAHAQEHGAAGVGCVPPNFFKPATIPALVAWNEAVAAACPKLPYYYYHIPAFTAIDLPMADFLKEAGRRIPNLAGMKFTFENLMDFGLCCDLDGGRYHMLFGRDEILIAGLVHGARGAIGSTYNCMAPAFRRLLDQYAAGDLAGAQREQRHSREFVRVLKRYPAIAAHKEIVRFFGLDCGPVRLPLQDLTADQSAALRRDLEAISFTDFCMK